MSGSGVRLQMPVVLISVQLKNLELKSLTKHACIGLHFSGSESDDLPAPPPPAEAGEGTLEVETTAVTPGGGGLVGSSSDATANQGEDETNANLEFKSMLDSQNNVPVSQSSSIL